MPRSQAVAETPRGNHDVPDLRRPFAPRRPAKRPFFGLCGNQGHLGFLDQSVIPLNCAFVWACTVSLNRSPEAAQVVQARSTLLNGIADWRHQCLAHNVDLLGRDSLDTELKKLCEKPSPRNHARIIG